MKLLIDKEDAEKYFKRYKRAYFKGQDSFTGLELQKCKEAFWQRYELKAPKKP